MSGYLTFQQWTNDNPTFDQHSIWTNAATPTNMVYVIPNQDVAKRAHIAVYNFTHTNIVSVSMAGVLNAGDAYQLISLQDPEGAGAGNIKSFMVGGTNIYYTSGLAPISVGTYNGSSIILPMTNLTVAPPLYGTNLATMTYPQALITPPAFNPEFGAFVVIGSTHLRPNPITLHGLPVPAQ